MTSIDAVSGALLGTAIGDALGLPYEKVSPFRAPRLLGPPDRFRFFFGRGLISDDTEHSCFVLQSLIESPDDGEKFLQSFAARLRRWLCLVPAGAGAASVKACFKLLLGVSPRQSGVFSAGNGPAMRAAVLGAAIDDLDQLRTFVALSSRVTHTDPRAEQGAQAVAFAAWYARRHERPDPRAFSEALRGYLPADGAEEFLRSVDLAFLSVLDREPVAAFAERLCGPRGASGFVLHTVPVALHAWLTYPREYRLAIENAVLCGGDADTTAAIVGGIVGSAVGRSGLPGELLNGLRDWPWTVAWLDSLALAAAERTSSAPAKAPVVPLWKIAPRNALFLAVVLFHGFRRLLPPY